MKYWITAAAIGMAVNSSSVSHTLNRIFLRYRRITKVRRTMPSTGKR